MSLARAAAIFAVDPAAIGGVLLRGPAGEARDRVMRLFLDLAPAGGPVRRAPISISDDRLLGGLDLGATLASGRAVANRGVLAEAHGGVLVLPMAERIPSETIARIATAMDLRAVEAERDGMRVSSPARFGVIALDESVDDEQVHPALVDRLAIHIACERQDMDDDEPGVTAEDVANARARLETVAAPDALVERLVAAAFAFGVDSVRACVAAIHAARVNAALEGRNEASDADAAIAARLILSPRARRLPQQEEQQPPAEPQQQDREAEEGASDNNSPAPGEQERSDLDDQKEMIVEAMRAAISPEMLTKLAAGKPERRATGPQGKGSLGGRNAQRGRPAGSRAGELRSGARLALLDTLRAAAPRQLLRRKEIARRDEAAANPAPKIIVRREDFRIRQFRPRTLVTTIFVVDASGSAALHRLSEAKGAVQALLAQCYVRRDEVALVAFRGKGADVLLPPTRSLTRVRRRLAQLPGGGGTPLAAGIVAGMRTALQAQQRGACPVLVFLTDGEANVTLDGAGGRAAADADVEATSKALSLRGLPSIVIDTSPRPNPKARKLSERLAARYIPLPAADPMKLANAVRANMPKQI
ncbi:MAG: magnesium chelatase subunit D [Beijerinckiaceae bacterium]